MSRPSLSLAAVLVALLCCPPGALASARVEQAGGHPTAVLDGDGIRLTDVSRYHCHDFAYPQIRCFLTEGQRDADMLEGTNGLSASSGPSEMMAPLGTQAVTYVLMYEHANFGGASFSTSNPVPNLGVYGWNDAVSSFKSTNGGRPKWWEHADYAGYAWQWVVSAWVSYVGDAANDRFSSVKNVP